MQDLQLSLKKMIITTCRIKGVQAEQILNEDPVIGGMGAAQLDSLDAVEIATSLERYFGLRAEEMPLRTIFKSHQILKDYIAEHAPQDKVASFVEKYKTDPLEWS
jgi:acyl carrier protein